MSDNILQNGDLICLSQHSDKGVIAIKNESDRSIGQSVEVDVTIPAGITFDSASPSQGTYNDVTGVWSIGSLLPQQEVTLDICFILDDQLALPLTLDFEVVAGCDSDTSNNEQCRIFDAITCAEVRDCLDDFIVSPDSTVSIIWNSSLLRFEISHPPQNTSVVLSTNVSDDLKTIATHDDGTGAITAITETVTSIEDAGGSILRYTAEDDVNQDVYICDLLSDCTIDGLSDVNVAGVSVSDLLSWNGTTWVPQAPLQFGEFQGEFDAAVEVNFPVTATTGDWFNVISAGTVNGQLFGPGDILIAIIDNPAIGVFAANWTVLSTPNSESTTVSDTTTVDLTLTGFDITADVILDPAGDITATASGLLLDVCAELTNCNLSSLGDVDYPAALVDGDILVYNNATSNFEPTTAPPVYTGFTMTDGTTPQTVDSGDTVIYAAGDGLDATVSALDTITYDIDVDPAIDNILTTSATGLKATESITTITNVQVGNPIGRHTSENGTVVDIEETITTIGAGMTADSLDISYVNEDASQGVVSVDLSQFNFDCADLVGCTLFTVTDGSNPFTTSYNDTVTVTSNDTSIAVDTSVADTINIEVDKYYFTLSGSGASANVVDGESEDFLVVPTDLAGKNIGRVEVKSIAGGGTTDVSILKNGVSVAGPTALAGAGFITINVGSVVAAGDYIQLEFTSTSGAVTGVSAILDIAS